LSLPLVAHEWHYSNCPPRIGKTGGTSIPGATAALLKTKYKPFLDIGIPYQSLLTPRRAPLERCSFLPLTYILRCFEKGSAGGKLVESVERDTVNHRL